jgi:hypothetical protein
MSAVRVGRAQLGKRLEQVRPQAGEARAARIRGLKITTHRTSLTSICASGRSAGGRMPGRRRRATQKGRRVGRDVCKALILKSPIYSDL